MNFIQKLEKIVKQNDSLLCIGLDSEFDKIPSRFKKTKYPQFSFNRWIIDQTHDLVCAYKPNSAFYEAEGAKGLLALKLTFDYLKKRYSQIITILDAKRGDIKNTNKSYLRYAYCYLGADAVTLNPYLGKESLEPFLVKQDKGTIIICRTSNKGASEFQDLKVGKYKLYEQIALNITKSWNKKGNCMLVAGATYPQDLKRLRRIVGENFWFLVPGIGAQKGDLEKVIKAGQNKKGEGIIINSARSLIFAAQPRKEAGKLKQSINNYLKKRK